MFFIQKQQLNYLKTSYNYYKENPVNEYKIDNRKYNVIKGKYSD
jgi:hypothetical protein